MNQQDRASQHPALQHPMADSGAEDLKMQTLFDTMNEGFCLLELICDDAGQPFDVRHLLANPAYERQTDQKLTDIIGRTARELHPGIEPNWIEVFGKVALTGEPAHFEAEFGSLGRWFQWGTPSVRNSKP